MGSPLSRRDIIDVGKNRFVIAVVPLHGHLELDRGVVAGAAAFEINRSGEENPLFSLRYWTKDTKPPS